MLVVLLGCKTNPSILFDLVITNVNLIDGTGKSLQQSISIGIKEGIVTAIDEEIIGNALEQIDGSGNVDRSTGIQLSNRTTKTADSIKPTLSLARLENFAPPKSNT